MKRPPLGDTPYLAFLYQIVHQDSHAEIRTDYVWIFLK